MDVPDDEHSDANEKAQKEAKSDSTGAKHFSNIFTTTLTRVGKGESKRMVIGALAEVQLEFNQEDIVENLSKVNIHAIDNQALKADFEVSQEFLENRNIFNETCWFSRQTYDLFRSGRKRGTEKIVPTRTLKTSKRKSQFLSKATKWEAVNTVKVKTSRMPNTVSHILKRTMMKMVHGAIRKISRLVKHRIPCFL